MPKGNRGTFFAIGLVAGVAVAVFLAMLAVPELRDPSAYYNQQIAAEQHRSDAAENKQPNEPQWWYWTRRLVAAEDTLAQWVMAFFTAFAVILLYLTLNATRATLKATREVGNAQVRAYMNVDKVRISDFTKGHTPSVSFGLLNSGQTPARDFEIVYEIALVPTWPDMPEPFAKLEAAFANREPARFSKSAIMPGRAEVSRTDERIVSAKDYSDFLQNRRTLVFIGMFRYWDVFGTKQTGSFHYFAPPGSSGEISFAMQRGPTHNDIT